MRDLDVILVGATGYTGRSCVSYISTRLPPGLRWGVAGRDRAKLENLVESLQEPEVTVSSRPIILPVNVKSRDEVDMLVKKTKVVISVVGPYAVAGSEIFRACARNGTHYIDCNGEVPWLREMIEENEQIAKESGSIMLPCCGFSVVPPDLSTYLLAVHLRKSAAILLTTLVSCHDFVGAPSGGSVLSALNTLSQYGIQKTVAACEPFALSPTRPDYLSANNVNSNRDFQEMKKDAEKIIGKMNGFGVQTNEILGPMSISLQDDMDRALVTRTWGLLSSTDEPYAPNFFYSGSRIRYDTALTAWYGRASYISKVLLALSPLKHVIRKYWYDAGEGPSEQERKNGMLEYWTIGVGEKVEGQGEGGNGSRKEIAAALCKMRFEGDLYLFTALCLWEAAQFLLEGRAMVRKDGGGIFTAAVLGEEFAEKLQTAGVKIEVSSLDSLNE